MKNRELLYQTEHLTVEYCPIGKYLLDTWVGYTNKATYLAYLDIIIGFLIERNIHNIIVDITKHQSLGPDAHAIAKQKMIDFSNKYGESRIAFILTKFVSNPSCQQEEIRQQTVTTAFFRTFEDAERWITKKPIVNHKAL